MVTKSMFWYALISGSYAMCCLSSMTLNAHNLRASFERDDPMDVSETAVKRLQVLFKKRNTWTFSSIVLLIAFLLLCSPVYTYTREGDGARPAPAVQIPNPVTLITEQDKYPLGLHLEILEDRDKVWTVEDVTSPEISQQFVPSQDEVPNFGFTDSAYWFRFLVRNEAIQSIQWLLEVSAGANPYYLDVYLPAPNSLGYEVHQTGTALPFNTRDVLHSNFVFKLPIATGEEAIIYLRLEAEGNLSLPLTILSLEALAHKDSTEKIA